MKYALKNAIILNGTKDMEPIIGMAVLVDRERIADIVPETAIPNGFEVVDLGGAYLLPGLINLHVHLATSGKPPKAEKKPPITSCCSRFSRKAGWCWLSSNG